MSLSRRSIFAAIPALSALLVGSKAKAASTEVVKPSSSTPSVSITYAWSMFEERTVHSFGETVLDKVPDNFVYIIGTSGMGIQQVTKPRRVVVPMGRWTIASNSEEVAQPMDIRSRMEALIDAAIRHGAKPLTVQNFAEHIGDADRAFRCPPPQYPDRNAKYGYARDRLPDLYVLSNGPIGYFLTDASDPHVHGLVLFADRIRVVCIQGAPVYED